MLRAMPICRSPHPSPAKRVSLMTPQEEFSPAYFSDIAAYLTLGSGGKVVLHTKTDVEIGDEENECNQDTQENNIGY